MVDLEELERDYPKHPTRQPGKDVRDLIAEVRALRAERDATLITLSAAEHALDWNLARVAELEKAGDAVVEALGHISHNNQWGLYQAREAWRKLRTPTPTEARGD